MKVPADIAGTVLDVLVKEGEAVAPKTPLARIEPAKKTTRADEELQNAHEDYAKAKAEATDADLEYQRLALLYKNGDIARRDFEQAQQRNDYAKQNAELSRQRLGILQQNRDRELKQSVRTIVAPAKGRVVSISVQPGDPVRADQTIVEIRK